MASRRRYMDRSRWGFARRRPRSTLVHEGTSDPDTSRMVVHFQCGRLANRPIGGQKSGPTFGMSQRGFADSELSGASPHVEGKVRAHGEIAADLREMTIIAKQEAAARSVCAGPTGAETRERIEEPSARTFRAQAVILSSIESKAPCG